MVTEQASLAAPCLVAEREAATKERLCERQAVLTKLLSVPLEPRMEQHTEHIKAEERRQVVQGVFHLRKLRPKRARIVDKQLLTPLELP